jgi:hypothetical protein
LESSKKQEMLLVLDLADHVPRGLPVLPGEASETIIPKLTHWDGQ